MPTKIAEEFAAALIRARREKVRIAADVAARFAADANPDDVIAVQAAVAEACGPVAAWKVAPGADRPMIAPILADGVRPSPATFGTDEIGACGIELEIAFRIDAPLPAPDSANFSEALRQAVTPLAAIEVVDGRFEDFRTGAPAAKLADNQINAGLVLGAPGTLAAAPLASRLAFGDKVVFDTPAAPPGGDAWATLEAFARHIGTHCGGAKVGHIVTTGSLTGMLFVDPGTHVTGSVDGLGEVAVTYQAS